MNRMKTGVACPETADLLAWYDTGHRDLPWRRTADPYAVWVSEIMLQQTRVETVIPYYNRFLNTLPDIASLAVCGEQQLLKLWEGLGYYSRVRNMQKAARQIIDEYGGEMPSRYDDIVKLCGIGPYTAGAIASIAFGEAVPAVDGNVLRVWSRLFECGEDVKSEAAKKAAAADMQRLLPKEAPGRFNQAMMELGACVCVPNGAPHCEACPWSGACKAHQNHTTDRYPVRSAAKARRIERRMILLVQNGHEILLGKRPARGLLAGLYELPGLEQWANEETVRDAVRSFGAEPLQIEPLPAAKHIFSHVEWHMKGYRVRIADDASLPRPEDHQTVFAADIDDIRTSYAVPSAFDAYMRDLPGFVV